MKKVKEKKKMGRPRVFTDEERRVRAAAYQRAWRARNPYTWDRIWKKSKAKREGRALAEPELDLSGL